MAANGAADDSSVAISVIMPIYNMADKLGQAIDSTLSQTLRNIEIVCVDDGSTDGSLDLLNSYKALDGRVSVLTQKNAGPGPARNAGMQVAKGEFLFFLDPDDWLPSNTAFETLYRASQDSGALVVGGNIVQADDSGRIWGLDTRRAFAVEGWWRFSETEDCYGYQRYIFNRDAILAGSAFFPPYRRGQDPVFMIRVMDIVDDFYAICDPVYTYRKGVGHVGWSGQKACDHFRAFGEVLVYSAEHGYRFMHSSAAASVMKHELLVLAIENYPVDCGACLQALSEALLLVQPVLLMNEDSYFAFVNQYLSMANLLTRGNQESQQELLRQMRRIKRNLAIRNRLVACIRRLSPRLSWGLQKKVGVPTGNYS